MGITTHDLLAQARERGRIPTEARLRMLVGRAYYACYHRCMDWEKSQPAAGTRRIRAKGVHQQLIERLKKPDHRCAIDDAKRSKWLGKTLAELRELRVRADYKLGESVSIQEVQSHVQLAGRVFDCCDGLGKPWVRRPANRT